MERYSDGGILQGQRSRFSRLNEHFAQEISESWTDSILIVLCFVTGLLDSAVFNVWSCFVSMQTGNTIYAGLGVSGQPLSSPYRWVKSLTSILSFMVGAYVISRLSRLLSPLRRSTVCGSFVLQAALCAASAMLVQSGVVPEDAGDLLPEDFIVLLPLGLLSFQAAGQIVMSRVLAVGEVTSVVLTSAYCDLMFDPQLLTAPLNENVKRNRRALSVVALLAGAIAGGFLSKSGSITNSIWLAGAIKFLIAIIWAFWKAKGSVQLD